MNRPLRSGPPLRRSKASANEQRKKPMRSGPPDRRPRNTSGDSRSNRMGSAPPDRRPQTSTEEPRKNHIYRSRSGAPGSARPNFISKSSNDPDCAQKSECGSCAFVNDDYSTSLNKKHSKGLEPLNEFGLLEGATVLPANKSPRELGYRSLFKLAVRPGVGKSFEDDNRFAIGMFQPNSHTLIEIDRCPLHVWGLRQLIDHLRDELEATKLTPYDEETGTGDIRYVVARAAHITGEISLTVVTTSDLKRDMLKLASNLKSRENKISSFHMNINSTSGNQIFGPQTVLIRGSEFLRERICELDFSVGPTSFFQINPWQASTLYRRVESLAGLSSNQVAWDLYCGTGTLSLFLARAGYRVIGIEENAQAVENARSNAKRNNLEESCSFIPGRVEENTQSIPEWGTNPDLIVVNPSRRGLAPETRKHIVKTFESNPKARLIYVSCDVSSLARDLDEITAGKPNLRQIESFDMFPQTDKLEWLAVVD